MPPTIPRMRGIFGLSSSFFFFIGGAFGVFGLLVGREGAIGGAGLFSSGNEGGAADGMTGSGRVFDVTGGGTSGRLVGSRTGG